MHPLSKILCKYLYLVFMLDDDVCCGAVYSNTQDQSVCVFIKNIITLQMISK